MLAALLEGDGLEGVAELAAAEAVAPVAIVIPPRGLAAASDESIDLVDLSARVAARTGDEPIAGVACEAPVIAGGARIGSALALSVEPNGLPTVEVDREEVLRAAALASLTVLAVTDARDEVAGELRGTLLEDLRAGAIDGAEVTRRAARMGCDLSRGAVALVAEVPSARPRHAAVLITGEHPGALAEPVALVNGGSPDVTRVYAVLPAREGEDARRRHDGVGAPALGAPPIARPVRVLFVLRDRRRA